MNLLLLSPLEVGPQHSAPDGVFDELSTPQRTLWLSGRRAEHLVTVLKVEVGQRLRAGILDFGHVDAHVIELASGPQGPRVCLRLENAVALPHPKPKVLLLAAPRPKVLSRCLEHAAALGFTSVFLFRSYRVDKSHLQSHKTRREDNQTHLSLGLEQSRRVFMPGVELFELFKPFVEDVLPERLPNGPRFLAHPTAQRRTCELPRFEGPYCLAIGPEGGFIPYEVAALEAAGFVAVSAGAAPLRVESALSYLTGQLDLLTGQL